VLGERTHPQPARARRESAQDGWEAELLGPEDAEAVLIVIHGGFWRERVAADSIRPLASALTGSNCLVWNVEYPRVGMSGGGWPGTAEAVARALDAALLEAAGRPVVALGHSAGAHLALWAASGRALHGVLALSAVIDLEDAADTQLGDGAVQSFLAGAPSEVPAAYAEATPLGRLPLGVRTVLVHGSDDRQVPISHSRKYALAAREAGDEALLVELEGLDHMQLIEPDGPAWPVIQAQLASLLRGETLR
jgi:acetyl esterase/lipase